MRICYFGIYNPDHARNRLQIKGMRELGHVVIECNTRERTILKYWRLTRQYLRTGRHADIIIVGFPGHTVMPLAYLLALFTRKKIIFDAFISLYDSFVFDEKKYSPKSLQALKYWLVDWFACAIADRILLEARAYAQYFMRTFYVRMEKCIVIPLGCDDEIMHPRKPVRESDAFTVHFHGTYIPAQGIPYILGAAQLLALHNIQFNLVGRLQHYEYARRWVSDHKLENVHFFDFCPYAELAEHMARADVCLGMFGATGKAQRAGAFKIVEALAMRKPLITADTPAAREWLVHEQNALLCKRADSSDLAASVLRLKNDSDLREFIAGNGYSLFQERMRPRCLGTELEQCVRALLRGQRAV